MSKVYYCIQLTIVLKLVVCITRRGGMPRDINYMCNKHYKETNKVLKKYLRFFSE